MSKSDTTLGWCYFNNSNEEWEWCETKPADNDDVHSVERMTQAAFFERFPEHDDYVSAGGISYNKTFKGEMP